jgi:hypothetical protein
MYAFNGDILSSIKTPSDSASAPLGYKMWVGSHSLGLVINDGSKNEFALEFIYGRFSQAFAATGGLPAYVHYDATYGNFCFSDVNEAAYDKTCVGITPAFTAAVTAGQYGWVQCGGLNGWALTTSEAAAVGQALVPVNGATTVEATDSDAESIKAVGILLGPAVASATTTLVGTVWIGGIYGRS